MGRIFYDTEFLDRGHTHPIDLISIGMIREDDGAELYLVNSDCDQNTIRTHPWLSTNVWPHLPLTQPRPGVRDGGHPRIDTDHPHVRTLAQIARAITDFVLADPDPYLWAWFSAYDHVVMVQTIGTMDTLPKGFPMYTSDLRQELDRLTPAARRAYFDGLPAPTGTVHHALDDARTLRDRFAHLDRIRA